MILVDRATDTVTDLANVERKGNIMRDAVLCSLAKSCLVHIDHFEAPFTRYNLLSNRLYNRIDNRLYRVNGV